MNAIKDISLTRDRVSTYIRDMIINGSCKAGDKILSERRMAQQLKVNHQTVRAALKQLAEEGLVETRKGSGTYVCDLPLVSSKRMVALLVRSEGHLFADFAQELSRQCQESGYLPVMLSIQVYQDNSNLLKRLHELKQMGCNHLITQSLRPTVDADVMHETVKRFPHLVWVWNDTSAAATTFGHSVSIDDEDAVVQAVSHLLKLGHKRFAFVSHGMRQKNKADFKRSILPQRWVIEEMLEKHGIPADTLQHVMMSRDDAETEHVLTKLLTRPDRPTAFIGTNDYRITKLIDAAKKLGMTIPGDLSVIGRGNTPWAQAYDLTTISSELSAVAKEALELLALPPESSSHRVMIKPRLIERNSTAPLR